MENIEKTEFTEWLEDAVHYLLENQPEKVGLVAYLPNGHTLTAYFNMGRTDKVMMADAVQCDALVDFLDVNSDMLTELVLGDGVGEPKEEENDG